MKAFLFPVFLLVLWPCGLPAKTLQVGPTRALRTLQEAAARLGPGDIMEVDGGTTYRGMIVFTANGTAEQPILIRGLQRGGRRPVLTGVGGVKHGAVVKFAGDHYVFEGFEVTAPGDPNAMRLIYHTGHQLTVRDCVVHDGPGNGIHNSDRAGSLTLERVEVFRCGGGDRAHQIYVGTDNARYPDAVFRMQFCRVYDGAGGNNVKSRAARSELYYNWIAGAAFHELDLIGADLAAQPAGTADTVREDADVVGNIFLKTTGSKGCIARIGSDGTGSSNGRYRFVHNTVVVDADVPGAPVIFLAHGPVQSLAVFNNVFDHGGRPVTLLKSTNLLGRPRPEPPGAGARNWFPRGSPGVPRAWQENRCGLSPGFADAPALDFSPAADSPLRDAGWLPARGPAGLEIPAPLDLPAFHPPTVRGPAVARPHHGVPDIGALEWAGGN